MAGSKWTCFDVRVPTAQKIGLSNQRLKSALVFNEEIYPTPLVAFGHSTHATFNNLHTGFSARGPRTQNIKLSNRKLKSALKCTV